MHGVGYLCSDCHMPVLFTKLSEHPNKRLTDTLRNLRLCEECFNARKSTFLKLYNDSEPREVYECACEHETYRDICKKRAELDENCCTEDALRKELEKDLHQRLYEALVDESFGIISRKNFNDLEEFKMFISRKPYGGETYKCCKCDNNFQEGAATFYREGTNDPIIGVSVMAKSGNRNQLYLCPECIEDVFKALGKAVQIGGNML